MVFATCELFSDECKRKYKLSKIFHFCIISNMFFVPCFAEQIAVFL